MRMRIQCLLSDRRYTGVFRSASSTGRCVLGTAKRVCCCWNEGRRRRWKLFCSVHVHPPEQILDSPSDCPRCLTCQVSPTNYAISPVRQMAKVNEVYTIMYWTSENLDDDNLYHVITRSSKKMHVPSRLPLFTVHVELSCMVLLRHSNMEIYMQFYVYFSRSCQWAYGKRVAFTATITSPAVL